MAEYREQDGTWFDGDDVIVDEDLIQKLEAGEIASDGDAIRAASDLDWMEQVRQERDQRVAVEQLLLGMPTWGDPSEPTLVVDFRVVPRPELEKFQRAAREAQKRKGGKREASDYDISFICQSAQAVYLRRPTDGRLVKVKKDGNAVRLDKRLGDMLKLTEEQNKDSRALLMYLTKDNGVAIGNLALTVARWVSNTTAVIEDEVLEEVLEG